MKANGAQQQIRIIAGQWRGRKINFPALEGLRPTSDRVRETLFNWLMHDIAASRCLDLFAGSGILGFEALSRGASQVVAVDQSSVAIKYLQENAHRLQAQNLKFICDSWLSALTQLNEAFDLVFLDPPFKKDLIESCCECLEKNNLLKPKAFVYVEQELLAAVPKVPNTWQLYREMKTQQVRAMLFKR